MKADQELYDIQVKVALKEAREAIERLQKANEILVEENLKLITEINDSKENRASEIIAEKIKLLYDMLNSSTFEYASKTVRIFLRYKITQLREEGKEKGKV